MINGIEVVSGVVKIIFDTMMRIGVRLHWVRIKSGAEKGYYKL